MFKIKSITIINSIIFGIECLDKNQFPRLIKKMKDRGFSSDFLNDKDDIRLMLL